MAPMRWHAGLFQLIAVLFPLVGCAALVPPTPMHPDGPEPPAGRDLLLRALEADERFGGAWMESQVVHVGVTRDADSIAAEYEALIQPGLQIRFHLMRYSLRDLEALKERIGLDVWSDEPVPPGEWPPLFNSFGITS